MIQQHGSDTARSSCSHLRRKTAATSGAFVPLLCLGIPGSGYTAVLFGTLLVLDLQPGPLLITDRPELFWGVIISMYVGSIFLLVLNLPLIPYIAKVLAIPRPLLISLVIMFSMIGVYFISFNTFDLYMLLAFGVLGYFMRLFSFQAAPLILAFILGGMMENSFRQSMTIANNDLSIFFTRPIVISLFAVAMLAFTMPIRQAVRSRRKAKTSQKSPACLC